MAMNLRPRSPYLSLAEAVARGRADAAAEQQEDAERERALAADRLWLAADRLWEATAVANDRLTALFLAPAEWKPGGDAGNWWRSLHAVIEGVGFRFAETGGAVQYDSGGNRRLPYRLYIEATCPRCHELLTSPPIYSAADLAAAYDWYHRLTGSGVTADHWTCVEVTP